MTCPYLDEPEVLGFRPTAHPQHFTAIESIQVKYRMAAICHIHDGITANMRYQLKKKHAVPQVVFMLDLVMV